ncbi:MAG: ZIP family metal transporter [Planctomycetota bacterium]
MLNALFWGLLTTSSLVIGGIIAMRFSLSKRTVGVIMAFGAGALISAVAYELIFEAVELGKLTGFPTLGLFTGAAVFYFADKQIGKLVSSSSVGTEPSTPSGMVIPMILGIILDGIPESIVIGLGILKGGTVSLAMLVAVFISNLPEAIAGSVGMKEQGISRKKVLFLWIIIAVVCALATVAGYGFFQTTPDHWLAFIDAFAAGAILMMLANSMMPEAYEHGGKLTGVFTVLGFFVSVTIVIVESS